MIQIHYGDNPYDYDSKVFEYYRGFVDTDEIEHVLETQRLSCQDLIKKKRMTWVVCFITSFNAQGSTMREVFRFANPLRQRIVLNPEAKLVKQPVVSDAWLNFPGIPPGALVIDEAPNVL
jgi:hypothetical protein